MTLPSYPLITIDPFMSIWSRSENLYDSDTVLWCGIKKRFTGTVTVDSETYRFMGRGKEPFIPQKELNMSPLITEYVFENTAIRLKVKLFTPLFPDELYLLSMPASFIATETESLDGKEHDVFVNVKINQEVCYDRKPKPVVKTLHQGKTLGFAKMGRKTQRPLSRTGDSVSADWGYTYICSQRAYISDDGIGAASMSGNGVFLIFFDDVESIEYMGEKCRGLWKENFPIAEEAIAFCMKKYDFLLSKAYEWNEKILSDAEGFSLSYKSLLTAAYRQILAGHKLVRSRTGDLLYFSKECHSNGCINTVDVSYPAIPFFLIYAPELVKAMMTGIFEFARKPIWKYDFAPHDIGQYPVADGQVYALNGKGNLHRRELYKKQGNYYFYKFQMPVEECGNMLIMAYTHFLRSGDYTVIERNYDLLEKWAIFLKKTGIDLENQLCTDDFAGHSKRNVNLAIKSIMGLACFGKISEALGIETDFFFVASKYAKKLSEYRLPSGILPFALEQEGTWSLKYNLVWDKVLSFNLFDKKLYEDESLHYRKMLNKYGVPLDHRKDFTKTDWLMWASVLDETGKNTEIFSECIEKFLADTEKTVCFPDWTETKKPEYHSFCHRTVQGGLWLPVLAKRWFD